MNYLNINKDKAEPVVKQLNILLADYHIYYQNLRTFHWNILGKNFFDLHIKFEELYNDARVKIDELAERILTLRFHPFSKSSKFLKISNINEVEILVDDTEMVTALISNHKSLLAQMSKVLKIAQKVGDEGTIDLIGSYIGALEKQSWMLNAWSHNTSDELYTSKTPKNSTN